MFEMLKTHPQDSVEVVRLDNHLGTLPTTSKNVSPHAGGAKLSKIQITIKFIVFLTCI